jgi:ABC-2 type transport system ATP-binding protein
MIELSDLQKVVDGDTRVEIDALSVAPGEISALVGGIYSGKDTLFELLIGQGRPTAGTIRVAGIDPYQDRNHFSYAVGVLFEEDNVYGRQTALWNLKFFCRLRRLPKSRADEVLTQVGLADHRDVRAADLPSGLLRRLSFGRAILHQPKVLVLADPFAKCDDASISLLSRLLRQLAVDGATVLILAGDIADLEALCDTIYRLDQGRIAEAYQPGETRDSDLPFMIPVRMEGKVALVDPADIQYVVAQDDRTSLQTVEELIPTQFTLKELEKRLARRGFFRAHRSYLVNLQHVKEVIPYTRNSFSLKLKDPAGTKIPLSKSAANELRELLDY